MSSISSSIYQIQSAESCFQEIQNSSKAIIKSALFAINSRAGYGRKPEEVSLDGALLDPLNIQIKTLVHSVFNHDEILESAAVFSGYESKQDYVVKGLTQALWDRVAVLIDVKNEWLGELVPSLIEARSDYDPDDVFVFFRAIRNRLSELTVEKAEEYGWITEEADRVKWPETIARWENNWKDLRKQIKKNEKLLEFSDDVEERREQYVEIASKLNKIFPLLVEKNQDYDFFNYDVSDLTGVCYTGCQNRIEQMASRAQLENTCEEVDYLTEAHRSSAGLRYEILANRALPAALLLNGTREEDLLEESSNVHNRVLLRQWANKLYHLGIPVDPFEQEAEMFPFVAPHLAAVSSEIMNEYYRADEIKRLLAQSYNKLSSESKDQLLAPIMDRYREDLLLGKVPYIDRMDSLRKLYRSLDRTKKFSSFKNYSKQLKKLHSEFSSQGFTPLFSALTPKESVEMQLRTSSIALSVIRRDDLRNALEERVLSRSEEERVVDLINQFENSESREVKVSYLEKQKKRISTLVDNLESHIALENSRLLKSHIEDERGFLEPFGMALWGVAAKVFVPAPINVESEISEEIIKWASELPLSNGVAKRFAEAPEIYAALSLEMKNSTAVKAIFS